MMTHQSIPPIPNKAAVMKVCVVVTGASRGFGRAVAETLCEGWHTAGHAVDAIITARSTASLKSVQEQLKPHTTRVVALGGDLGNAQDVKTLTQRLLEETSASDYDRLVVVNNAGTLGDISKHVADYDSLDEMHQFMMTNITSEFFITSSFMKAAKASNKHVRIVNVSSLLAVQAHGGFALYCASRAARDMYTAVAAKEAAGTGTVLLSYAPGPLDTDMQADIRERLANDELRAAFADMKAKGTLVTPASSASKLFELLESDDYESGAHIDYYDKEYPKRT
ncbi:hypothetical protein PTSG_02696 [Salpingoeca rosetta]|uniref:Sepiapterin reductase n=1 Tax=Salpingoeca rosetta (strain ATCC 50818 / BSB-021) TaxID=946362 RepID=F2U316_SALR5|nr:uncharacterized protein PTSG_02696 [Salpingoeca rosetta]EGD82010.1 hypothetical protein PTSG_02696 [Salpingoeca rosetta]|eukprot:XP_004996193.1 hypothetical protein PTSG_02696 [Salpingoeca rosetta]